MKPIAQLRSAILQRKAASYFPDDSIALDNTQMLKILDGRSKATAAERAAILGSPMTLRRFLALAEGFLAGGKASQTHTRQEAANDTLYVTPLRLLAADSGSEAFSLTSDDGWWRLSFPQTREGWLIELEMREDAPFEHMLDENLPAGQSQRSVAVVDGQQRTLLLGQLNFNRALSAPWPLHESPREALAQAGGVEVVVV